MLATILPFGIPSVINTGKRSYIILHHTWYTYAKR